MESFKENPNFNEAGWLLVSLVVLTGILLILKASAADISTKLSIDTPCVKASEFVKRPAMGLSCQRTDGLYEILLKDGTRVTTHGGDPTSIFPTEDAVPPADPISSLPSCVEDRNTDYYVRALYVRTSNYEYEETYPQFIRAYLLHINKKINETAGEFGYRASLKIYCQNEIIHVSEVVLGNYSEFEFSRVIDDLKDKGYNSTKEKYVILWTGPEPEGIAGIGTIWSDDSTGTANKNNSGPSYAAVFSLVASTVMHEMIHNLGGVQNSAPNATGGFHCIDDEDVMCYADGGENANEYSNNVCDFDFTQLLLYDPLDCNNNDYFRPNPPSGSYLKTHWNVASSSNRFLDLDPI